MFKKILNRFKRAPIPAVTILLFAAVISVIICALQMSNDEELLNYEETWKSVPITLTVTAPSGENNGKLIIDSWVLDLFTGDNPVKFYNIADRDKYKAWSQLEQNVTPVELPLSDYIKDVQVMMKHYIATINGINYTGAETAQLYGITSLTCDKQLLPENGCHITWYEGYNESIFAGEDMLCIIPEEMAEYYDNGGVVDLHFTGKGGTPVIRKDENGEWVMKDGEPIIDFPETEYNCSLKIVGTYTAGDGKSIYCPYPILNQLYAELDESRIIWSLSATLADNNRLDEFREVMSYCFLEPSPDAGRVSLGVMVDNGEPKKREEAYYSYAIDINDDNLFDLSAILEDSIKFNRTVTVFVVILSVVSGFLVGFLMIRRRKRDIMLMRSVGESNPRVFFGFIIEQMICILLGIAFGGAYNMWEPLDKLLIFALVYFVGLTISLSIFISKKLIRTIKEDE